jgi:hypothetical protein
MAFDCEVLFNANTVQCMHSMTGAGVPAPWCITPSHFGLFISNMSRVLQYQFGLCIRPIG